MENKIGLLVTTEHRGVFFGYVAEKPESIKTLPKSISMENARNCISWDTETKGFLGLAAQGPSKECRIGPKVPELILFDVTSVAICSEKAIEEWEKEHWAS